MLFVPNDFIKTIAEEAFAAQKKTHIAADKNYYYPEGDMFFMNSIRIKIIGTYSDFRVFIRQTVMT